VSEEYLVSIDNLKRLQCIEPLEKTVKFGKGFKSSSSQQFTVYDDDKIVMTTLGIRFVQACSAEVKSMNNDSGKQDDPPAYKPYVEVETEVSKDSFRVANL
jgi:hypothetical protein